MAIGEHRGFMELESNIEADDHQYGTEQERNPPTPGAKLLIVQAHGQGQEQPVGRQEADGGPQLGEHAEPGALALGRVLGGEQRRAAPFTAQPQALAETQHAQQDRRPGANAGVAGQHADEGGAHAHQQQGRHQRRLAPDPVAEMAEQRRAQRAGKEGDAERQEGRQHLCRA